MILKIVTATVIFTTVPGCSSPAFSIDREQKHFADAYYYYKKPVVVDPDIDTILFYRRGQVLTPILVVADGKFFPFFSGTINLEKVKKIRGFAVASMWGGGARAMTGDQAEFDIVPCSHHHFLPTDKRYDSIGIYANRRIVADIKPTPKRCAMGVMVGGDTYNTSVCLGTDQWTTDLNGNGKPETWIAFPQSGEWVQVWENYGDPESALILDTAHPALPTPELEACNNHHLFR